MRKTTVYLSEDASLALRRLSISTGRPQAELVREAIEGYVSKQAPKRVFRSAGIGRSSLEGGIADREEELLLEGLTRESGWEKS